MLGHSFVIITYLSAQAHYMMKSDFMSLEHVAGKDKGRVMLYALSTCVWCNKTKEYLSSKDVAFDYIYVDLLRGEERTKTIADVKKYNASLSFPTLVVGEKAIIGFREKEIKEALGI